MTAANAIGDKSAVAPSSIHHSLNPHRGSDTTERRPPAHSQPFYRKRQQPKTNRRRRCLELAVILGFSFGTLVAPNLVHARAKKVNPLDVHPQKCVQSDHITFKMALEMERKQDLAAAQIQNKRLSIQAMFPGLPYVPSDSKIVSGFGSYQVQFPTQVKVLPSTQSPGDALYVPPIVVDADCVIAMPDGSAWIVSHDYTGELFYINKEPTEPYRR